MNGPGCHVGQSICIQGDAMERLEYSSEQCAFSFFTWTVAASQNQLLARLQQGAIYILGRQELSRLYVAFGSIIQVIFRHLIPSIQLRITIPSSALSLDADTVLVGFPARPVRNYYWRRSQRHHTHRFLAVAHSAHRSTDGHLEAD